MVMSEFLIVFLIVNIPISLCRYSLEAEESFVELGVFQKLLYMYNVDLGGSQSCYTMIETDTRSLYSVYPIFAYVDCHGFVNNCQWSGKVSVCGSTIGRAKLQWVEEEREGSHHVYPSKHSDICIEEKGLTQYESNEYHSACNCDCFHTNWAVYVARIHSRENEHRVIVGLRFILRDNVLYLQPADATLEKNKQVSGFSWVPLPIDPSQLHRVTSDSANFFLDDLRLNQGYVLTGVQLIYMETTQGKVVKGFGITVSGRPFFKSGELDLGPAKTLTIRPRPDVTRYSESDMPVVMDKVGMPLSLLSAENHEYVPLKQSEKSVDYGQTTVPLFHNPRRADQTKLLAGFGIFHETAESGERFITLRFHERDE